LARPAQRSHSSRSTKARNHARDNEGILPVLARAVREVEGSAKRGKVSPSSRAKFQAIALLVRDERARVKADDELGEVRRTEQLKRLDGVATILAQTAARDTSLLQLLADEAVVSSSAKELKRRMLLSAGLDAPEEETPAPRPAPVVNERAVVPQSVISRQLADPFLAPDFSSLPPRPRPGRLANWELLGPLFRAFEDGGTTSCMDLPEPKSLTTTNGMTLMRHQAQVVAAAAKGHRTFLLADEPGLGKTAQALLSARAANAYPLLVVVPNVVKANWAHEVGMWTPNKRVTVVHGNGETVDAFADIVVVNYEILDRHVGWMSTLGFRGMVVDEAHFIKNKSSQRSQNVLEISQKIRERRHDALFMALTGTPLINDIEDFTAIWQFLGWIDEKKPIGSLMQALEETGLTPADRGFSAAGRTCVIEQGIVRRRKADVASDIPERRIADLLVELDDAEGRSIRAAERDLARRLVQQYERALELRDSHEVVEGIDETLVRRIAVAEREKSSGPGKDENVFSMMRRIGQAKADLAADYAAQLVHSVGKVVLFAKHVDVMDAAEKVFAKRGLRYASIRGEQTARVRQKNLDAFVNDPDVAVVVCSLTAAGVGLNLQVASNVVLAELSWTDAEQTQAIDRVHRIGQGEPVTAWRILAAQTLDTKIAQLVDAKAGLAARALDGSDGELSSSADVQVEALVQMLTEALETRAHLVH
jgi:superfamily II DNA or RNA helicase